MKKKLKVISDRKEIYELIFWTDSSDHRKAVEILRRKLNQDKLQILDSIDLLNIQKEYSDICFEYGCLDKKQNALKIYMNTFYGETANHLSSYYLLELAGGVTSAGQYNIILVAKFAKSKGYGIKY